MSSFTGGIIGNYCRYAKIMCTYCNNLGHCELSGYCVYKKLPCETVNVYQVSTKELPGEIIINGVKYIKEVTYDEREIIKGKWQTVAIGGVTNGIRCTVCKHTTVVPADRTRKLNFCPECGADMREVKE